MILAIFQTLDKGNNHLSPKINEQHKKERRKDMPWDRHKYVEVLNWLIGSPSKYAYIGISGDRQCHNLFWQLYKNKYRICPIRIEIIHGGLNIY
jgi:hypothetical protein